MTLDINAWNTFTTFLSMVLGTYSLIVGSMWFFNKKSMYRKYSTKNGIPELAGWTSLIFLFMNVIFDTQPDMPFSPTGFVWIMIAGLGTVIGSVYGFFKGVTWLRSKFPEV